MPVLVPNLLKLTMLNFDLTVLKGIAESFETKKGITQWQCLFNLF